MNGRQRREARDLVRFIEAHGGKLGPFRVRYPLPSETAKEPQRADDRQAADEVPSQEQELGKT